MTHDPSDRSLVDCKPAQMIRSEGDTEPIVPALTPCGRVPHMPLRKRRHEIVALEIVVGKTPHEAGVAARYKDTPSLANNITRLCRTAEMRERIEELAIVDAERAGIYAGWLLSDVKLLARSSIAHYFHINEKNGLPELDLRLATAKELEAISEISFTEHGPRLKLHSKPDAQDKLMRYLGLYKDKTALTDPDFDGPARIIHEVTWKNPCGGSNDAA